MIQRTRPLLSPSGSRGLRSLLALSLSVALASTHNVSAAQDAAENAPTQQAVAAPTFEVQAVPTTQWFELEAIIEAVHQATISAQTSGRIAQIQFDVNDYVEQGQIVAQLVDTEQRAALRQAQAQVAQTQAQNRDAQLSLQRAEKLHAQGSLSQGQLDSAKAQAKSAAAAVKAALALKDQAEEQLSYTQIRAPYSGIVKNRHVEVGEMVSPGKPVMTGLSLSKLRAVADVPQRFAPQLRKQQDLHILVNEQTLPTQNLVIFPYADPKSHTFKVRVDINAEGQSIFPGMWVKLTIPTGSEDLILIPFTSVIQRGELAAVYVQTDKGFALRQVRLGERYDEQIEILSGLRPSETIASDGYNLLAQQERR